MSENDKYEQAASSVTGDWCYCKWFDGVQTTCETHQQVAQAMREIVQSEMKSFAERLNTDVALLEPRIDWILAENDRLRAELDKWETYIKVDRDKLEAEVEGLKAEATVAGGLDCSLANVIQRCEHFINDEQVKPLPDNALISTLCDSIRAIREYCDYVKREKP